MNFEPQTIDKGYPVGYIHGVTTLAETAGSWLRSPLVRRGLQVAAIAVIIFFFGRALIDLAPQIVSYNWRVDPAYLLLALGILIVRGPVAVYGWRAIVQRLGYPLPFWVSVRIVYYSALAGFVPGSMWHAVSRMYLAEKHGVPRLVTAVSVALETVVVAFAAAMVACLSLIAWRDPPIWLGVGVMGGLLLLMLWPDLMFRALNWGLRLLKRQPLDIKLTSLDMLKLFWPYAINWLLFGVMSFCLVAALYPGIPWANAPAVAGLFSAGWLAGYLAIFVPQGLVVREFLITSLLNTLLGVPLPVAAGAALLSRAWTILQILIWGAISTRLGQVTRDK